MTKTEIPLQEKIKQLDELVKYFEEVNQDFDLDAGLKKYEQAMQLVSSVKAELESFELKIREVEAKYVASPDPETSELMS
jgi:exonuclease VII small subunit